MAFDDGTPLDAAKLQALETKLNSIEASIPKIGTSQVNITGDVINKTETLVKTQIAGGVSKILRVGAKKYNTVTINMNLDSKPLSVVVTPIFDGVLYDITFFIKQFDAQTCMVRVHNGYTSQQEMNFQWLALCGNK
jgi:hypothetical protein